MRTASNECIKLAKSSFPQYVVSYPVLEVPYLQNILNFTTHYHILKSAILSHPIFRGKTFFMNFYRIAAYDKQIRCLAYAQGSTFGTLGSTFVQWKSQVCRLLAQWRPRQVGELYESEGSMQALPLLLQPALGTALLIIFLVGLKVFQRVLLLLISLLSELSFQGWGTLLPCFPIPMGNASALIKRYTWHFQMFTF